MSVNKCDYGYAAFHKKQMLVKSIFYLVLSAICFTIGFTTKVKLATYLFKVLGALDLLPFANAFVGFIMSLKLYKVRCDEETYNKISSVRKEDKPVIRYDMYITTYDKNFPIKSLTCFDGSLVAYTLDEKFDHNKFDEHIKLMLANNMLKVGNIKVFDNLDKYLGRISDMAETGKENTENDFKVMELMENLSV
ncbi:MAG TPA: hypothetical protein DCP07_08845 [Lachnospiraceae bacterium]|nr:hypothetical protein [Lachnospiraceae bacterium]